MPWVFSYAADDFRCARSRQAQHRERVAAAAGHAAVLAARQDPFRGISSMSRDAEGLRETG